MTGRRGKWSWWWMCHKILRCAAFGLLVCSIPANGFLLNFFNSDDDETEVIEEGDDEEEEEEEEEVEVAELVDEDDDDETVSELLTRTVDVSGIVGNNTDVVLIGGVILAVIVAFEVAMFALDVYYNQTYGSRLGTSTGAGSRHDNSNHGYSSGSGGGGSGQGNSYGGGSGIGGDQNFAGNALPLLYKPYPKYRDPFLDTLSAYSTYRSIGAASSRRSITADRILQWISLAHETYLAGSDVLSDFSCQKKLVCELYWESDDLGELSSRGAHGLDLLLAGADVSRYVTLPQPVNNAIEEFKDARESSSSSSCEEAYPRCLQSLRALKSLYDHI